MCVRVCVCVCVCVCVITYLLFSGIFFVTHHFYQVGINEVYECFPRFGSYIPHLHSGPNQKPFQIRRIASEIVPIEFSYFRDIVVHDPKVFPSVVFGDQFTSVQRYAK